MPEIMARTTKIPRQINKMSRTITPKEIPSTKILNKIIAMVGIKETINGPVLIWIIGKSFSSKYSLICTKIATTKTIETTSKFSIPALIKIKFKISKGEKNEKVFNFINYVNRFS